MCKGEILLFASCLYSSRAVPAGFCLEEEIDSAETLVDFVLDSDRDECKVTPEREKEDTK